MNGKQLGGLLVQKTATGGFILRSDVERVPAPGVLPSVSHWEPTGKFTPFAKSWSGIFESVKYHYLKRADDLFRVKPE